MKAGSTFYLATILLLATSTVTRGHFPEEEVPEDDEEIRPINNYLTIEDEKVIQQTLICKGWPCPIFRVVKDITPYIQERHYDSHEIITATNYGCGNFTAALNQGYAALFRYRKGNNAENRTVQMSTPVVMEITQVGEKECKTQYKLWIYNINASDVNNPLPSPIEENVKIEQLPAMNVYVRTFRDRTNADSELVKLQDDVHATSAQLCFSAKRYMIAMYDPPWRKKGRRNEVWIDVQKCDA